MHEDGRHGRYNILALILVCALAVFKLGLDNIHRLPFGLELSLDLIVGDGLVVCLGEACHLLLTGQLS